MKRRGSGPVRWGRAIGVAVRILLHRLLKRREHGWRREGHGVTLMLLLLLMELLVWLLHLRRREWRECRSAHRHSDGPRTQVHLHRCKVRLGVHLRGGNRCRAELPPSRC